MENPGFRGSSCAARWTGHLLALLGTLGLALVLSGCLTGDGQPTRRPATATGGPTADPRLPRTTSTQVPRAAPSTGPLPVPGAALPPLSPATGFASGVTGGAGGTLYRVTSAEDSPERPAPGTLRYGLRRGGPTWIVFDRDLTIRLRAPLPVPSDTTLDGRGRAVELTGHGVAGLHVYDAKNVIIENLTLHDFGDVARTRVNDPDDAIDLQRSSLVWIDHCSLSVAGDKLISTEEGGAGLTFSWNHFSHQEQTVQVGAMATAYADLDATVTLHHNWFDHVGYRLPVVQYAKAHVFDNYLDSWSVSAVRSERLAQIHLESNVFRAAGSPRAAVVEPAQTCNDDRSFCDGRPGFLTSVGNLVEGTAFIRTTPAGSVFDPRSAYPYTAEPATLSLAVRVSNGAGAHPSQP